MVKFGYLLFLFCTYNKNFRFPHGPRGQLSILVGELAAREHSVVHEKTPLYQVSVDDLASLELEPLLENLHGADIASEGDGDAPCRGHDVDVALLPREKVLL